MQTRREHLLPGEKLFPIYRFYIEYTLEYPTTYFEDTTEHTEIDFMAPQPMTAGELEAHLRKLWLSMLTSTRYTDVTLADRGGKLVSWGVSLHRYDNWALRWFQHETRNVHLSDEQLLISFERFVNRKMPGHIALQSWAHNFYDIENVEKYCLMGAKDRWRWKGPCRCQNCTEQGVVRIDH